MLAPAIGLVLGYFLKVATSWTIRKQSMASVNKWSRVLQLFSAAAYSLAHGSNDAQKTMGIITSLLFAGGIISVFKIPLWVVLIAYSSIALGTISGGWRIIKTMGQKITKLTPIDGFCAETAAASSIFLSTYLGVPVSTTHVITGAISGVGVGKPVFGGTLERYPEHCGSVGADDTVSRNYCRPDFFCNQIENLACI